MYGRQRSIPCFICTPFSPWFSPPNPSSICELASTHTMLHDPTPFAQQGLTALDYARREGKADVVAILEEHEQYLSQIGSHTKAAMREPAHSAAELQADQLGVGQADEPVVNLLDMQQSLPSSDDSRFPDPGVAAGSEDSALRMVGLAETHGMLAAGTPQLQTQTMPALDLGGLDFDLPE
eukprot:m.244633 g.244633  ORF g.244633 m.244633 type:complete len:180 (+) comp54465_c0_seq13:462-1001(+)